jgi:hypothetical protein
MKTPVQNEKKTHGHPIWHQIALVYDENDLLMRLFFCNVVKNRLAHSTHGVASVQNMKNDIRRINNLVEFSIYPTRCAFCIYRLNIVGVCLRLGDRS